MGINTTKKHTRQKDVSLEWLQSRVNQFLAQLNCSLPLVTVEILMEDNALATAQGITLLSIPIGKIKISQKVLKLLTDAEIDFVLAHEVAHIYLKHLVGTVSFQVARALVEDAARSDTQWKTLLTMWDSLKVLAYCGGNLPPSAALTKEHELEADAWAVFLTRNKVAAHSALSKLVGNNLSAPSHTWEVFDTALPVMTIRERLSILDNRFR